MPLPLPLRVPARLLLARRKTTAAQHVAARHLDHAFERLATAHLPLVAASPLVDALRASPEPLALPDLARRLPLRLHRRGPLHFLRLFPRVFHLRAPLPLSLSLTPAAAGLLAVSSSPADAVRTLHRLLALSLTRSLPLRAVFRVWRELALPDDFEDSVVEGHPHLFRLVPNPAEPNTHILHLVADPAAEDFTPAVEKTRPDRSAFKLQFPPGFRLTKEYRKKVKEWQLLPYTGPYEVVSPRAGGSKRVSKMARRKMEKRAVGIAHEFLSLTVEKMVEVEKFSQFRKWFGIEVNVRDVFLDHPGIFYLSAKGKRHMVFLREAYDRGKLVEPNEVSEARDKLVELMLLRRRGLGNANSSANMASCATADAKESGNLIGLMSLPPAPHFGRAEAVLAEDLKYNHEDAWSVALPELKSQVLLSNLCISDSYYNILNFNSARKMCKFGNGHVPRALPVEHSVPYLCDTSSSFQPANQF